MIQEKRKYIYIQVIDHKDILENVIYIFSIEVD